MALTWKDVVTTLLAAAVFGLYYAMSKGINIPIINSYRWLIITLGIIGIAMCAFSGGGGNSSAGMNPFILASSILGVTAFILIIYGLIVGTKLAVLLLTGTILLLWVLSTLHHIIGR